MRKQRIKQPQATGDATARYERLSHSGTTWFDLMPTPANGTDGTVGAAFTWPDFNGDAFVNFGNPTKLQYTNNWSISAWASQSDTAPASAFERLISRDNLGSRCFILSQKDSNGVAFAGIFVGNVLKSAQGTNDYADNNWHHYMITHDGTTLKLYVDGTLEASGATGGPMDNDAVDWEVGRAQNSAAYLEGRCDIVRFYNRTLSADEIIRDYHAGLPAHS